MRIGPMLAIVAAAPLATAIQLATTAAADDVRILTLPNSVRGVWAPNADACADGKGRIDITAKTHSTPDVNCEIAWITVTPSREGPVYSARSMCTQIRTGQKDPPSYLVISPRPDNQLLVRMPGSNPDGEPRIYRKC
ncbi:hypothetical protein [Pseudorhodoplanes sp.]|uniref:hypothetical protein n=1 Tax=Pseudorhodoplanes sp. TaxID=1934341 RepID=UPI002C4347DC|nr:hypothetical protein [Pseudorhodoplanes sp.]HWV52485.1 hypothetical protein [Pseudorhodoplanes sp.]